MNTKQIEDRGAEVLKKYIEATFKGAAEVNDIRNNRNIENNFGCDLILTFEDQRYYIELKASQAKELPTNIRFTHQTLAKMYNAGILPDMIVAYVYNLGNRSEAAKFKFFRFGNFTQDEIIVEPHFIIQPKQIIKKDGTRQRIRDSLGSILDSKAPKYEVGQIFKTRVSDHMKL